MLTLRGKNTHEVSVNYNYNSVQLWPWAIQSLYGFGITLTSIHYQGVAAELRGTLNFSDERGVIFGLVLMVAIALAPLKYMWDVRH